MENFKSAQHGKFLSPIPNKIHSQMWSLAVAPRGYRSNDIDSVRLFMQLCAMPTGIQSIELSRKLECVTIDGAARENVSKEPFGYPNASTETKRRQNSGWGK